MDDQLIIELFKNRSEKAITETSAKYGKLCKSVSNNILKNEEDVDECVNDTYLTLWNRIPPEEPNPFVAYICKIVRNISLKKYRYNTAEKRNTFYDASLDELAECLTDEIGIEEQVENDWMAQELTEKLNAFLAKQKDVDRVIFVKRFWFCKEISEIADEMDLSTNYVNVHLHRTKEKLKRFLEKENYYEARIS